MKKRECVIVSGVAYPHLIQEDSDTMRQILILALVSSRRFERAKAHYYLHRYIQYTPEIEAALKVYKGRQLLHERLTNTCPLSPEMTSLIRPPFRLIFRQGVYQTNHMLMMPANASQHSSTKYVHLGPEM